jgi:ribosomal protein S13
MSDESDASLDTVGQPNAVVESEEPAMTSEPPQPSFDATASASTASSEPAPPPTDNLLAALDLTPKFEVEQEVELTPEEELLSNGTKNRLLLVRRLRKRLRNDKDAIVVLTGERGIGKTVCAHCLARGVSEKFDMRSHTLFDPEVERLKDIIYKFPKYSATVVDELIRIGYRRNWASVGNKLLIELYNLCRYQNQTSFLCIPNFNDIDKDLQDNVTLWVHVVDRGTAVVFKSDQNPFVADKWHLRENEKLIQGEDRGLSMNKWGLNDKLNVFEHKIPNFYTWFGFPDFTPEEKVLYKALKVPYEMKSGDDRKVEANKAARVRIERAEKALSGALLELYAAGVSVSKLEEVTGLPRQKIGRVLSVGQGKSLQTLKREFERK